MRLYREYTFEAAHRLEFVPPEHKCGRMHGHTYRVRALLRACAPLAGPWLMDFAEVDACCKPTIDALDHTTLNDRLAAPTAERLAEFLFHAFSRRLPGHVELVEVDVRETDRGGAIYP